MKNNNVNNPLVSCTMHKMIAVHNCCTVTYSMFVLYIALLWLLISIATTNAA